MQKSLLAVRGGNWDEKLQQKLCKIHSWNSKQPLFNGCSNWMIPNHYLKNCCLEFQVVPQTLETANGCWASQILGGNAWREGSWISLVECEQWRTNCWSNWRGKISWLSHAENHILLEKMGRNNGRNTLDQTKSLASGHVAPRVKSRFAVGGSWRSSPKMLKTRPLPTTSVFRACPSCEMCQWNNDLLRW